MPTYNISSSTDLVLPLEPGVFTVSLDGTVVYSGKIADLSSPTTDVNISPILRNFVSPFFVAGSIGFDTSVRPNSTQIRTFTVNSSNRADTITMYYDYSYRDIVYSGASVLSNPINGHFDYRQMFPFTAVQPTSSGVFTLKVTDPSYGNKQRLPSFYNIANTGKNIGTVNITGIKSTTSTVELFIGNSAARYSKSTCGEYCLYYINASGGWDAFLLESPVTISYTTPRETYSTTAARVTPFIGSSTVPSRDTSTIIHDIEKRYLATTGWLTDSQSSNFCLNLLQTPDCYIHNLSTGVITSCYIESDEIAIKSRRNLNGKLLSYQFTIVESHTRSR